MTEEEYLNIDHVTSVVNESGQLLSKVIKDIPPSSLYIEAMDAILDAAGSLKLATLYLKKRLSEGGQKRLF